MDNLSISPGFVPLVNNPPTSRLTAPVTGASYLAPADILITAEATDTDGSVSRVEFFAGPTLVGVSTTAPYSVTWTNVAAGTYSLTAQAYDDRGASAASTNSVMVTVSEVPGEQPTLTIARPNDTSVVLSWPTPFVGYRLQSTDNLNTPSWTDVPTSDNTIIYTTGAPRLFFRLIEP